MQVTIKKFNLYQTSVSHQLSPLKGKEYLCEVYRIFNENIVFKKLNNFREAQERCSTDSISYYNFTKNATQETSQKHRGDNIKIYCAYVCFQRINKK